MSKHLGTYSLLSMIILFMVSSCGEYEALEIQKSAKRSAESMFRVHRDSIKKLGDTLCDIYWVDYHRKAFDSIREKQLQLAKELIKK